MAVVFLALGSNLGNRERNIQEAVRLLKESNFSIQKFSSIIETDPVGFLNQGKFFNAVIKGTTTLDPFELLALTQSIEQRIGRQKTFQDGPRAIDIDILLYDQEKINTPALTIPHPRMWQREFVLRPLNEIEPELTPVPRQVNHLTHPTSGYSAENLSDDALGQFGSGDQSHEPNCPPPESP